MSPLPWKAEAHPPPVRPSASGALDTVSSGQTRADGSLVPEEDGKRSPKALFDRFFRASVSEDTNENTSYRQRWTATLHSKLKRSPPRASTPNRRRGPRFPAASPDSAPRLGEGLAVGPGNPDSPCRLTQIRAAGRFCRNVTPPELFG